MFRACRRWRVRSPRAGSALTTALRWRSPTCGSSSSRRRPTSSGPWATWSMRSRTGARTSARWATPSRTTKRSSATKRSRSGSWMQTCTQTCRCCSLRPTASSAGSHSTK
eukprot:Amastigsp_a340791_30.p5 type:complete len:110 gc:universal Amastigsp_a340791_30:1256-1585(+)